MKSNRLRIIALEANKAFEIAVENELSEEFLSTDILQLLTHVLWISHPTKLITTPNIDENR